MWWVALLPALAQAQVFVYPRHAEKSPVRYFDHQWRHVDILVGPASEEVLAGGEIDRPSGTHVRPTIEGSPDQVPADQPPAQPQPGAPGPGGDVPAAPGGTTDGGTLFPGAGASSSATTTDSVKPRPAQARADGGQDPWYAWPEGLDAGTPVAAGAPPTPRSGGVRLFFYERERKVAERAAHIIVGSYRTLVDHFQFVPTQTFPYVLYSSYQEFLQTTLFPLQEGVLGVTSTQGDLKLTLPYFGDHRMFADVSLHEMAHQFTIQKVRFLAEQGKVNGDPLENIPLWFIEGLAEFYAKNGIDDEADLLIRDLVTNPDPELGYALIDFWEDRPYSVLWTYQAGQIRVTFLEEEYGRGFIQRVLNESPTLVGSGTFRRSAVDFRGLLERLSGDTAQVISKKFEAWLKRRAYRAYLNAQQDVPQVELFPEGFTYASALNASPSGEVVLYRTFEEETGRSRLVITDPRIPNKSQVVVTDGVPGAESLHPVFGRNFDIGKDSFVYVAEVHGHDVLYWQKYRHQAVKGAVNPAFGPPTPVRGPPGAPPPRRDTAPAPSTLPPPPQKDFWEGDLSLGDRVAYPLEPHRLMGAFYPSMSPDGKRVAFVGLDRDGVRDLYVLEPTNGSGGFELTRLTNDEYSERQVAWGPQGIVYASDATAGGHFNLFRIAPGQPQPTRVTNEPRDHLDPVVLPDGRLMFAAFHDGRSDVYEVVGTDVIRRTDIATGVFDLSPGPDGGLWALFHYRGRRQPVQIKKAQLLSLAPTPQPPAEPPYSLARSTLTEAKPYRLFSLENWELDPPFGFIGAGQGQVFGQVYASTADRLRNHGIILNAAVYGRFDLTNGFLLYLNQAQRVSWGAGLFQVLSYRYDTTFPHLSEGGRLPPLAWERFYGALGTARYPFNPFVYVEAEAAVGGMTYFLDPYTRLQLATPEYNGTDRDLLAEWNQLNGGHRLQTELSVRLGYDTLRYHPATGPIGGNSVLLEVSGAIQPLVSPSPEAFGSARLDAEQYFPIAGRTHLMVRGGLGTAFGGRLARQYFLSSFDTIRGVPFGDPAWLLGRNFAFGTAELQVPLNAILRFILLSDVEAIAGFDVGGVGSDPRDVWDHRVVDAVVGVNFALGPLIFRLHFARPFDTGAAAGMPVDNGEWVTNFSLGVMGLPGFGKRAPMGGFGSTLGR